MKVWIAWIDYGEGRPLGVFSSEAAAAAAVDGWKADADHFGELVYDEFEIDAPVEEP